jgi:UDP-2,3-diacylglucosamine pyrophosphatase LpxH
MPGEGSTFADPAQEDIKRKENVMLVIVSDIHLTDGSTGLRMPAGALRVFRQRLEDMAYDASKRTDLTYRPLEAFDLLFLGDIFDLLRSTQWTQEEKGQPGYARPWSDPQSPALAAKVGSIADAALQKNAEAVELLRKMADGEAITLPPATADGKVDRRASHDPRSKFRLPVKVNLHYMLGNHDWLLHLPGSGIQPVRQKITSAMHLANPGAFFPHDPAESPVIQELFSQHSVFGRHGDIYDPLNYIKEYGREHASLGDALVVELFNRIPLQIRAELGGHLPQEFFSDLDEMGSIRPEVMTPVWIASLLDRHQVSQTDRQKINEIWQDLVERFLKVDFLDALDKPFQIDMVDAVKTFLRLLKSVSIEKLDDWAPAVEKVLRLVNSISGGSEFNYDKWAVQEEAYRSKTARFIVYGHTHGYTVYPLRSIQVDNKPFDQMYLNSGTWSPTHDLCRDQSAGKGFIFYKTMTFLGFYKGDERQGRRYETWSGTLEV